MEIFVNPLLASNILYNLKPSEILRPEKFLIYL